MSGNIKTKREFHNKMEEYLLKVYGPHLKMLKEKEKELDSKFSEAEQKGHNPMFYPPAWKLFMELEKLKKNKGPVKDCKCVKNFFNDDSTIKKFEGTIECDSIAHWCICHVLAHLKIDTSICISFFHECLCDFDSVKCRCLLESGEHAPSAKKAAPWGTFCKS